MATQDLAHVNHHMLIHFIQGMRVAIIPPSAIQRQRIEHKSKIQATWQHKIWLMWTITCLFTLSKVCE